MDENGSGTFTSISNLLCSRDSNELLFSERNLKARYNGITGYRFDNTVKDVSFQVFPKPWQGRHDSFLLLTKHGQQRQQGHKLNNKM